MSTFLAELKRRIVVFDGAMGTSIQGYDLSPEDFGGKHGANDHLVLTRPDVIAEIHDSFFSAGAQVVETCTFQATRTRLSEWGVGERTQELNQTAAELARKVADRYATPDFPTFVSGSMGPTGFLPSTDDPELGSVSYDQLYEWFFEQASALIAGGVDSLQIETSQDMLEVRAALAACRDAKKDCEKEIAIIAQITLLPQSGTMLLGTDVGAALTTIEGMGADVVGLNCSTGPEQMIDAIRLLSERSSLPLICVPNAGLPENRDGEPVYPLEAEPMALALKSFVSDHGVNAVGGCCGTTPEHIRQLAQAVRGLAPASREIDTTLYMASGMTSASLLQEPRPLIVGERVNSVGSRKMKRLLLTDDYPSIIEIARHQVDGGAHVLDVCVALTERDDEMEQMTKVVKLLSQGVPTPLVIDSTEADVIDAALKQCPGRAIVNSINLEGDGSRVYNILPIVAAHGASVIALTIDEEGMAHTADKKFAIAERIYNIATKEFNIAPGLLLFDTLTFPLTTGQKELRDSARQTIDAIGLIKEKLPEALTILGVSNVSFGVGEYSRSVLNSVFLHHCVQAGLDAAIVNPADIRPYIDIDAVDRKITDALIYNTAEDALATFIQHFEASGKIQEDEADPREAMEAEEAVHHSIVHRRKEEIESYLKVCLSRHSAVDVINNVLLPAMQEVGDKFGSGELILPFVLESAEVMKRAVAYVEPFLDKNDRVSKGTVVLATVFGDVHDIGKNLVRTILTNNGFECIDLGKQVPVSTIIDKAKEVGAKAIGLSALLVSTSKQMGYVIQELDRQNLDFPVLVGGAAINGNFGRKISLLDGRPYAGGVFYCNDAFEGLDVMNILAKPDEGPALVEKTKTAAVEYENKDYVIAQRTRDATKKTDHITVSSVAPAPDVPTPPFWGAKVVKEGLPFDEIFDLLNLTELYKLNWGVRADTKEEYEALIRQKFEPLRLELQQECIEQKYLEPKVVYGYWPAQSDGNTLKVYEDPSEEKILHELLFPREPTRENRCLADYWSSKESGRMDVVAFQVVTVGERAAEISNELSEAGEYTKGLYLHGLAVQVTEALAEYMNRRIRKELGISQKRGLRYSYGYPACPDMEEQLKLFDLLQPTASIGVSLTEGFQMDPEHSTNAIFTHHPKAKYFNIS